VREFRGSPKVRALLGINAQAMASQQALPDTHLVIPPGLLRKHPRRWLFWLLGALALVLIAVVLALFLPRKAEFQYRSASVVRRTVVRVVEATGRLDVTTRVEVPAPMKGTLEKVFVKAGAPVEEGQPLAQLDPEQARVAVGTGRSSALAAAGRVAEAKAALDAATDARRRTAVLAGRGLASDGEVVSTEAAEQKAEAALTAARAALSGARESASSAEAEEQALTLKAPMKGVVLDAPKWSGEVVSPEKGPLVVIGSDPRVLRVEVSVAEADIGLVQAGQSATFTVPAFPDRSFSARVEERATEPQHDGAATTYLATLSAANPDRALLPGMTATVRIEVARVDNALAVREAALRFAPAGAVEAPHRTRVFRLGPDQRLTAVAVDPGVSDAAYTAITPRDPGALKVGDAVVVGLVPEAEAQGTQGPGGPGITLGRRR